MKKIFSVSLFLLLGALPLSAPLGCASPGTVGVKPSQSLIKPVAERVDAYVLVRPDCLSTPQKAQYEAAKASIGSLPSDSRVAAATAWLSVQTICDIHDTLVKADANFRDGEEPWKSYLRSTEILRRMYAAAFAAAGVKTPESKPTPVSTPMEECPNGECKRFK